MKAKILSLLDTFDFKTNVKTHIADALDNLDNDFSIDDFRDKIIDAYIHTDEIIYYHDADTYLMNELGSLSNVLEYYHEMVSKYGELKYGSCTLASILRQNNMIDELDNFISSLI